MPQRAGIKNLLPWIAAVAGGIVAFLGYAGFDHFYLEWICLVPVLWAIRGQSPRRAFLMGWVAGIVGHGGGFYWIVHMFQQFAGLAWPFAVLAATYCRGEWHRVRGMGRDHAADHTRHRLERGLGLPQSVDRTRKVLARDFP